jgi:hypothetical protein
MKNPAPARIDALIQVGLVADLTITAMYDWVAEKVPGRAK